MKKICYLCDNDRLPVVQDTFLKNAFLGLSQRYLGLKPHQLRTEVTVRVLQGVSSFSDPTAMTLLGRCYPTCGYMSGSW